MVSVGGLLPARADAPTDWSGNWVVEFEPGHTTGVRMTLAEAGGSVSGAYSFHQGTVTGTVGGSGTATLTGRWSQDGGSNAGQFQWVLSGDGNSFTGLWKHDADSGFSAGKVWKGKRENVRSERDALPLPAVLPYDQAVFPTRHALRYLAVWNLWRGTRVTLRSTGASAPAISVTRIAPASGFVNFTRFVRNVRLPTGTVLSVRVEYRPPSAPDELYQSEGDLTVKPGASYPELTVQCATTTPSVQTPACHLPCPPPAGISLHYCAGASQVLHFRAEVSTRRVPHRGVRITRLAIENRSPGATISVGCDDPGSPADPRCPAGRKVFPGLTRRRVTVRGLRRAVLRPGTRLSIHIYRGNSTGQQIEIVVRPLRSRQAILVRRNCRFSDGTVDKCPPAPGPRG